MKKTLAQINKLLIEKFGIPKRAVENSDPVDMLIATILSQNTNDRNSYKAFLNLREKYSSWQEVYESDIEELKDVIRIAGLANQKSKAIKDFLSSLKEKGKISLDYLNEFKNEEAIDNLTLLKGIGVKTASCVLLFSLGRNVCPVDTHLHRIFNRLGIVKTSNPEKTFNEINKNLPNDIAHSLHTNLIRLGREICKPKNPACIFCPLEKICKFEHKNFNKVESSNPKAFMLLDHI